MPITAPSTSDIWRELWRSATGARDREEWSASTFALDRDRRVRAMVRHAYLRVPFYRELYDAHGVDIAAIRGKADLHRLPIIHKRDLQTIPLAARVARGWSPRRLRMHRTSGSSGQPLDVPVSKAENLVRRTGWQRALRSLNLARRERFVAVTQYRPHPLWKDTVRRIARRLGHPLPERLFCRIPPAELARRLSTPRAEVITGYPRAIVCLVREADPESLAGVRPRIALLGGDTLPPQLEAEIRRTLATEIVHSYASTEFGMIAQSCRETGELHRNEDLVVTQVVDDDGNTVSPGSVGRVIATGLNNWAAPIIRYDHGDLAVQGRSSCSCGAPFPTFERIEGRRYDQFPLADGSRYEPWHIVQAIEDDHRNVLHMQLEQLSHSQVTLRVVLRDPECTDSRTRLRNLLDRELGGRVECELRVVNRIESGPGHKLRLIHSRVWSHYESDDS